FALKAQDEMFALLAARPGDASDATAALAFIRDAVDGTQSEEAQLTALAAALKTPTGKLLSVAAQNEANRRVIEIGERAFAAYAPLPTRTLEASGAGREGDSWETELKLRHYRALKASIADAAAKTK